MSTQVKLDHTKLFGVLNELDGTPIRRKVRSLKVGIGLPQGPDVHIWIDEKQQWAVGVGEYPDGKRSFKIERFATRAEAADAYTTARKTARVRKYPVKLPYFTFLKMGIEGDYIHDLDAIEKHGPIPTEVNVVFLMEDPLDAKFQWFTAAELKCEGNGLDARRRLSLALTEAGLKILRLYQPDTVDEQIKLATEAQAAGQKFYPIIGGCYVNGCPFGHGEEGKPPVCKPHGRLFFQLIKEPKIGSTCSFDTTGKRSISQLASCLDELRVATRHRFPPGGTVAGIPLVLIVRPYKVTKPDGAPTVQHGVSLEARGTSAKDLWMAVLGSATEFHDVASLPPGKPLELAAGEPAELATQEEVEAASTPGIDVNAGEIDENAVDAEAAAMAAEFYVEADDEFEEGQGFTEGGEPTVRLDEEQAGGEAPVRSLKDLTQKLKQKEGEGGEPAPGSLFAEPAQGLSIRGIQFPADLTTGEPVLLLQRSMESEAARAGVDLIEFVKGVGIKVAPSEFNEAAARAMVFVLRTLPNKGEPEAPKSTELESKLAAMKFVTDVVNLRKTLTDENEIKACDTRIDQLKAEKRNRPRPDPNKK